MNDTFKNKLNLHLFDEGEGAAASTGSVTPGGTEGSSQASGVNAEPTQQSTGNEPEKSPEELRAEFQEAIKGKYKGFYDEAVKGIVKERFKKYDGIEKTNKAMAKTLSLIGQRYGTEDPAELYEKISSDTSLFADQALEAGMSEEAFLNSKRMEFENKQLRADLAAHEEEAERQKLFRAWHEAELEMQKMYPDFNLQTELANPDFGRLLSQGINMDTVYKVIHMNDLVNNVAKQTAQVVADKAAAKAALDQKRPSESGSGAQSGFSTSSDVNKLTKSEINQYIERARRGEKISFT